MQGTSVLVMSMVDHLPLARSYQLSSMNANACSLLVPLADLAVLLAIRRTCLTGKAYRLQALRYPVMNIFHTASTSLRPCVLLP